MVGTDRFLPAESHACEEASDGRDGVGDAKLSLNQGGDSCPRPAFSLESRGFCALIKQGRQAISLLVRQFGRGPRSGVGDHARRAVCGIPGTKLTDTPLTHMADGGNFLLGHFPSLIEGSHALVAIGFR